ncbi:MAG: DUF6476 family protein [Pseudomonadota bacterium]
MDPSPDFDQDPPEPAPLRRLRLLVTVLTVVLIAGMVTMVASFVIRLGLAEPGGGPRVVEADRLMLPVGAEIRALGQARGTVLVATDGPGGEVLWVFDAETGEVLSKTPIGRE